MNNVKNYAILAIFSLLIAENHCGLLDSVFGTVRETTNEVTSGVGSLLSFGKDLVTRKHTPTGKELAGEKKGIISGFIDSVHENIHEIHQKIRNVLVGDEKNSKGIIGNVMDKMKHKIAKISEFFTAGKEKGKEVMTNSNQNVIAAYQNLNTLIFGNGTHKHNSKVRELIKNLKDGIKSSLHKNKTTGNENTDGSGLIDIRMASDNIAQNFNEDIEKTKTRFNEGIDELNKNVASNINYIEKSSKDISDRGNKLMEASKKKIDDGAMVFRD